MQIERRLIMGFIRMNNTKTYTIAILLILLILMSSIPVTGSEKITENEEMAVTQMVYFSVNGCKDCIAVKAFIDEMSPTYEVSYDGKAIESRIEIIEYDIGDPENLEKMYQFYEAYDVPKERQFVPSIYIGNKHLLGEMEVKRLLIKHIKDGRGLLEDSLTDAVLSAATTEITLSGKSILGVLTTGLINGFNPCSISMILFLFSLLLTKKSNVLKLGLSFIAGKFISYLLLGTAFYSLLTKFNFDMVNSVIKIVLIVLFAGLSLMNFLDFLAAKSERYGKIKMQLPAGLRRFNHNMIKKMTDVKNEGKLLLLCFVLGLLISAGEFLCTGQIYLATILYVLQNSDGFNMMSLLYFVLYCLAFILPLIVITIIIHKSKSFFSLSEAVREKMHIIKLVNALLFLAFLLLVIVLY